MIFEVEKQMNELGDKVNDSEKTAVENAKKDLQEALNNNASTEDLKSKMEALTNAFYPISTRIYQEAQAAQSPQAGRTGHGCTAGSGRAELRCGT